MEKLSVACLALFVLLSSLSATNQLATAKEGSNAVLKDDGNPYSEDDFKFVKEAGLKNWRLYKEYYKRAKQEESRYGTPTEQTLLYCEVLDTLSKIHTEINSMDFHRNLSKVNRVRAKWASEERFDDDWFKINELRIAHNRLFGSVLGLDKIISTSGFERAIAMMPTSTWEGLLQYWENYKRVNSRLGSWLSKQK